MLRKLIQFFTLPKKKDKTIEEKKSDALNPLQQKLMSEMEEVIPRDFIDSFTEDFIEEPVLTEYGHVFQRSSIEQWLESNQTCPLTRAPLTRDELIVAPGLKVAIAEFKIFSDRTMKEIKEMKSLNDHEYEKKLQYFQSGAQVYLQWFTDAKQALTLKHILTIKNEQRLDINNIDHLEFWSEDNRCCFNCGLVKVNCNNKGFYLSQANHAVFMAAAKPYARISDFRHALEGAKNVRKNCWASFWGDTDNTKRMLQTDFSNTHRERRLYY